MGYLVREDFRFRSLRALRPEDVDNMLEWMHDSRIASVFGRDFMSMSRDGALSFIESTRYKSSSMHFAVAGPGDEYLGTISLKDINADTSEAEYAIVTRRCAHGTGIAYIATRDLLDYAFRELLLNRVYLCVRHSNSRAIAFYRKVGFTECDAGEDGLLWFEMLKGEYCEGDDFER